METSCQLYWIIWQGKGSDDLRVSRIQDKETLGVGITLN